MLDSDTIIEQELIKNISNGLHQSTKLETDDKVLARVTDGIYRLPKFGNKRVDLECL